MTVTRNSCPVDHRWNLYTDGSGVARFGIGQNNADFAAAKILLRDRWHYVAGTYDGEHIRIFVDGVAGSQTALHDATIVRGPNPPILPTLKYASLHFATGVWTTGPSLGSYISISAVRLASRRCGLPIGSRNLQ